MLFICGLIAGYSLSVYSGSKDVVLDEEPAENEWAVSCEMGEASTEPENVAQKEKPKVEEAMTQEPVETKNINRKSYSQLKKVAQETKISKPNFGVSPQTRDGFLKDKDLETVMTSLRAEGEIIQELRSFIFPEGEVTSKEKNADGSTLVMSQTAAGETIEKFFQKDGDFVEVFRSPEGEKLTRFYSDRGVMSTLEWSQKDGSSVTTWWDDQGKITNRANQLTNGDRIVFKYDDRGEAKEIWRYKPDGRWIRIF